MQAAVRRFSGCIEAAIQLESRDLALELLHFLRDADRARGEFMATARARAESLASKASGLLQYGSTSDEATSRVRALVVAIRDHLPDPDVVGEELRQQISGMCASLRAVYEDLAAALRADSVAVPQLRPANYKRNLFHVGSAIVGATIVLSVPNPVWLLPIAGVLSVVAWTMEIGRRVSPRWNRALMHMFRHVSHPHEAHRINSATWYMTALLLLSATLNPMITAAGIAVLGLGDPMAAIVGRRFGRIKLVRGRTLEGSLSFIVFGMVAAAPLLWLVSRTGFPSTFGTALGVAAVAATFGALAELFSKSIDDNFSVPLAAAAGAWLGSLLVL